MEYSKENLIKANRGYSRNDFLFFWGHTDRRNEVGKACLSQWYPSPFTRDGEFFHTAEQYMMAGKACTFGDEDVRRLIMEAYDPMSVKKLGRRVRNFNEYVWRCNRLPIVVNANLGKFSQNEKLLEFLLGTDDRILVEASPYDSIWGIGLVEDDPAACNPKLWKGENLLGFALMTVRDILREKDTTEDENLAQALNMWTMGAGNSARRFNMEDPIPPKNKVATADSWKTKPLDVYVTVAQDFYLTDEQMAVIRYGHIPDAMEDHWFMYCDENTIRYYRSWTGICFAQATYEPSGDGFRITELRINNNPKEYQLNDVDAAVALFYGLLISEYGGNSSPYWKAAF